VLGSSQDKYSLARRCPRCQANAATGLNFVRSFAEKKQWQRSLELWWIHSYTIVNAVEMELGFCGGCSRTGKARLFGLGSSDQHNILWLSNEPNLRPLFVSPLMEASPRPPSDESPPPAPPPAQKYTGSPTDFLKGVVGKRVVVRLTSGVDYRGHFLWNAPLCFTDGSQMLKN